MRKRLPGAAGKAARRLSGPPRSAKSGGGVQVGLPHVAGWTAAAEHRRLAQIITEVQPKLVITTGTAGGIGKQFEVGDVVVSPIVRFDCTAKFKKEPFAQAHYLERRAEVANTSPRRKSCSRRTPAQLPKDNTRPPKIVTVSPTAI